MLIMKNSVLIRSYWIIAVKNTQYVFCNIYINFYIHIVYQDRWKFIYADNIDTGRNFKKILNKKFMLYQLKFNTKLLQGKKKSLLTEIFPIT